jgi:hypothetical protein
MSKLGNLNDTLTTGSMIVMILDECAEGQDVYDEYEDGYMDVGAGFLLPPLRRVLQCQSASSQRMGNRSGSGHIRQSRRMHKRVHRLVEDLDALYAEEVTESFE